MITTMRAQLAPALLLVLILLAAAAPLVPALNPQEIRDRKINGANKMYIMSADPDAYAGEKKSVPESKEEAPKDAVQKPSYVVMGAGMEPKPVSKSDEKVLDAKVAAEVVTMRKEAAHDDAVVEKKDKELKSKPKNTTDDAEDHAKEKKEKKPKNKDDDSEEKEKKSKSKSERDDDDEKKEKKSKSKKDEDDEKKEKKSKSKEDDSEKKSKSKNKEEDFDAVPVETKADESTPAASTPNGYAAPTKKTAQRLPGAYQAPVVTTMSAEDSPDGYAAPTTTTMSAADTPDGYVPATDSPDGNVPASDSPDGYAAPSKKPTVSVQSFEEMVPRPVLDSLSPLVKSMCAKTSFPYACEMYIAKLPETKVAPARQKDSLGVLTLAVDAVRAKIAEAANAAKRLNTDPRTDKTSKGAISDCLEMYDSINTSYDTALAALKRGDKPTATSALDAARTYVDTCDQGFLDRPGLKPVIADQEKTLAQLSSNVLAINRYV